MQAYITLFLKAFLLFSDFNQVFSVSLNCKQHWFLYWPWPIDTRILIQFERRYKQSWFFKQLFYCMTLAKDFSISLFVCFFFLDTQTEKECYNLWKRKFPFKNVYIIWYIEYEYEDDYWCQYKDAKTPHSCSKHCSFIHTYLLSLSSWKANIHIDIHYTCITVLLNFKKKKWWLYTNFTSWK